MKLIPAVTFTHLDLLVVTFKDLYRFPFSDITLK